MKFITSLLAILITILSSTNGSAAQSNNLKEKSFKMAKDLLLVNFDCKTDVDDLHTVAAFATLLSNHKFSTLKYHAVAGTYGIQEGLYIPPNDLLKRAFGNHWTDAHKDVNAAVKEVSTIALATLREQGDIWIAEAGQSDFSAAVIRALQKEDSTINFTQRIHIIQHSTWNEEMTTAAHLAFVKNTIDYYKIPDGNILGNGTPGFQSASDTPWSDKVSTPRLVEIWQLAIDLANQYNGKEGRYLNKAVAAGGLDFSDLSEVCWILDIQEVNTIMDFFDCYGR